MLVMLLAALIAGGGFYLYQRSLAPRSVLTIATGAPRGTYHRIGQTIEDLLKQRGIPAKAEPTHGSIKNASLLADPNGGPAIAIMQYDIAVAVHKGGTEDAYGKELHDECLEKLKPKLKKDMSGLKRIALLHNERVHIIARKGLLSHIPEGQVATVADLRKVIDERKAAQREKLRICLGPEQSGTQVVAKAVLRHHRIRGDETQEHWLSVDDMVEELHTGKSDVGFFVSFVPCGPLKSILESDKVRLLSMEPCARGAMTRAGIFTTDVIAPATYDCQKEGEAPIQTVATRAVLVAREQLPDHDVQEVTKAIFEGAAFLPGQNGAKAMAEGPDLLPLHPDAKVHYQKAGLLPSKPPSNWISTIGHAMAILVILIAGYRGFLELKRKLTAAKIGYRVLAISLDPIKPEAIDELMAVQREVDARVQRQWWTWSELGWRQWSHLRELVDRRLKRARENLTRSLSSGIRTGKADERTWAERSRAIRERVWACFEKGVLDSTQKDMLLGMLDEEAPAATAG